MVSLRKHESSGMMDVHDVVSDYYIKLLRNLTNTSTELACTDDFVRALFFRSHLLCLPQLPVPLQQPASAAASWRVLEPDILEVSPVWLYVLRSFVCMSVFDFRAYDLQLKTKIHFRGTGKQ
jgi:hypothetical protein